MGLSPKQFIKLLSEIEKGHCLIEGRCVKYVDSSFDFRTKTFWRIVVRPFGAEKEFIEPSFEQIMNWLKEVGG